MNQPLQYGVKIIYKTIGSKGEEQQEKIIQYIIKVSYGEDREGNLLCELNRKGFSLNGERIYRLIDVLAEQCMQELYPFVFRVSRGGVILGVNNLEEIQRRWANALPGLKSVYVGEEAETYFNRITKRLYSSENFRQAIKKDVFYYLFFMQQPAQDHEAAVIRLTLVSGERPAVFTGEQTVRSIKNNTRIRLEYNGEYDTQSVRRRSKIKNGKLELKYTWDAEGFTFRKMEGKSHIVTNKEREVSYKITRL